MPRQTRSGATFIVMIPLTEPIRRSFRPFNPNKRVFWLEPLISTKKNNFSNKKTPIGEATIKGKVVTR